MFRTPRRCLAAIVALFLLSQTTVPTQAAQGKTGDLAWKQVEGTSIPIPPKTRPRLYLRANDVPGLKERMSDPVLGPVWEELTRNARRSRTTRLELEALQYLLDRDAQRARRAIAETVELLENAEFPDAQDISRKIGRTMVTGAMVYDWCYDQLTPDQKERFIKQEVRLARMMECGYPPVRQGSVTGHSSERMIMRDMISAGIALYDEFPEMYDLAAGRFFREHQPARNWFYPGHAYHQGDSYGPYRFASDLYPLWIFSRMGAGNVFNPEQQFVPYQWIYMRRPDGQLLRGGDTFLTSRPRGTPWPLEMGTLLAASFYGDGYVLDEYLRAPGVSDENKIFEFLWRDPKLRPRPVSELPLSHYMGSPFGWMIARTGWDDGAAIVEMKVNEYNFSNHQHLDAGAFQVYYRGALAIDSGVYQGTAGGYGNPHDANYSWRTIAHNSLLVYDPQEQFSRDTSRKYGNDGGQRLPNGRSEPRTLQDLQEKGYRTGSVLAHGFGPGPQRPEYTYLEGDITAAYSQKVKEVRRSFVFLNLGRQNLPGALVIFDKVVSSNPQFKKYWLLHGIEEPQVSGTQAIFTRTEYGSRGKLVVDSLLPRQAEIARIGGPGKEAWVFGQNYPNDVERPERKSAEPGAWRIEISPKTASADDEFLNVLQIMDVQTGRPAPAERIDGRGLVGARLADRAVLFRRDGAAPGGELAFSHSGPGAVKVLVTGLAEGKWQVLKDGEALIQAESKPGERAIYFAGPAGRYTLRQ